MATAGMMHSEQRVRVSFALFKPQEGCHIDDVVDHIVAAAASIEKCINNSSDVSISILRSISSNWAAAISESKKGVEDANPWSNLLEATAFTKGLSLAVRIVESGWFEMNCGESKAKFPAFGQNCVGDVVSVRRIYSQSKNQDKLTYCCLALLKSYFTKIEGLHSYTYYESLDGERIIGLGKWESVETAYTAVANSTAFPAEAYWKSLGAKKLKFDVCRVVYASKN